MGNSCEIKLEINKMAASESKQVGGVKSLMEEMIDADREIACKTDVAVTVQASGDGVVAKVFKQEANSIRAKLIRESELFLLILSLFQFVYVYFNIESPFRNFGCLI